MSPEDSSKGRGGGGSETGKAADAGAGVSGPLLGTVGAIPAGDLGDTEEHASELSCPAIPVQGLMLGTSFPAGGLLPLLRGRDVGRAPPATTVGLCVNVPQFTGGETEAQSTLVSPYQLFKEREERN